MRVLISILSDYLQPNFLLIKELAKSDDVLMFVSTETMEAENKRKSYWLEKALKLPENSVRRITVVEDDFDGIKSKLAEQNFSKDDEYILNLTGGTKVMPLAAYEFFKEEGYNVQFYYVPIGKNVINNLLTGDELQIKYSLNLVEYFTLNSLRFECDNKLTYSEDFTNDLFERFRKVKFNRSRITEIKNSQSLPTSEDRRYYGGIWFEEYCYTRLKRENNLPDDAICKGAKIFRQTSKENDNDIDVMFVKNNQLYVFECKVGMTGYVSPKEDSSSAQPASAREKIEQYQYKLAAIAKDFGLRVEAYILTLHKVYNAPNSFSPKVLEHIEKRQNILGIRGMLDSVWFTRHEPLLPYDPRKRPAAIAPKVTTKQNNNKKKK